MQSKMMAMCLIVSGLLVVAAGCGKPENAGPATQAAPKPASAAKADPAPTAEKLVAQTTNAFAAATNTAGTTLAAAVKAADTAATPVSEAALKAADAPNPAADKSQGAVGQATATIANLSQDQMVRGLEDALAKGLQQAIARLGHDGGFLTNVNVKIPMPEKMQKVENALRAMKQDKLADDFVTTMNHAAEQAVPEAGSVFADTLKQMSIQDAQSILTGPNDAATRYFQKTTQTNLYARFYPIVQKATEKTGVTAAYKNLMDKANVGQGLGSLGSALGGSLLGKDSLDIDAYVTGKAMDGLFKMVAEEEQQIRQNPVARTTDMLQKVFGAFQK
ncbi:MAG TPA: DUF4197 domain-containing protein [Candidatus Binatia bacterium]|jgi:hypothetical protein|nr:DUF4197 domain-containing protein [Candidatus Binatia bacterium]